MAEASQSAESLITVRSLRYSRGGFTLDVPAWDVEPGTVVGLVGPNGAGKTTLLHLLAGFLDAGDDSVRVLGRVPAAEPVTVRSRVGYMSDDMPVFSLRVGRLLRLVSGYYPDWDAALVERLVDRFGIDLRKRATRLSRGEGSRLRLVLAMAFRPRLLLLDEPAAGLDLGGRRTLVETVLETARDAGRAVVVSSHLLQDVERVADRLLVLEGGRVVRDGPTAELVTGGTTLEEALVGWGAAGT